MEFETVIGLEVHVQLNTNTKIFSSSKTTFGSDPNKHIDPVTLGLPGALPVLNKEVINKAISLGLATNCKIKEHNFFARKHYFYPDLPKGYQISQFEDPICLAGNIDIELEDGTRKNIGITRIHMEEDAGKNIHDQRNNASLVDLNRAGVPLLEVVSEPDLRNTEEVTAYLKSIRRIVRFINVSDGNMDQGSLRCDANVSIRPVGQKEFGTRCEIKNLNSFKFIEKAIHYEVDRQKKIILAGGTITQETRLFNSETLTTHSMRGKEESADYRYFADPDLPPLHIDKEWVERMRKVLPPLPQDIENKLVADFKLSEYDAKVLTAEKDISDFFAETNSACKNPKAACNWITSELFGFLNKNAVSLEDSPIKPKELAELILLIDNDEISGKMAKKIFEQMLTTEKTPLEIKEEKGFKLIKDPAEINVFIDKVFEANTENVQKYLDGNENIFKFFVGQVLKETAGNAKPEIVNECILEKFKKLKKA